MRTRLLLGVLALVSLVAVFTTRVSSKMPDFEVYWTAGSRSKWCNPRNAGLGAQPTTRTASKWADAYLWISRPGLSSNGKVGVKACGIGPQGNVWWDPKALWEARQANFAAPAWPPKPL